MHKRYILPLILVIIVIPMLLFYRQQTKFTNALKPTSEIKPLITNSPSPTEPALMQTTWQWVETKHADGSITAPVEPSKFRLTLADMKLHSTTDCNTLNGSFIVDQEVISFGPLLSTKMYCANSQESAYSDSFPLIVSYHITDSLLTFILIKDTGTMRFAAVE